jgi:prepilin-type N-terminal cleavage/methylation domain-containing protein
MFKSIRERITQQQGFTLTELLVAVILVGLLAAISLSSLISQRTKGEDAEAKSGVVAAAKAMETCGVDNEGWYSNPATPCTRAALLQIDGGLADLGTRLTVPTLGISAYRVTVASKRAPTQVSFTIRRRNNGRIERECDIGSQPSGGCLDPGGSGNDW